MTDSKETETESTLVGSVKKFVKANTLPVVLLGAGVVVWLFDGLSLGVLIAMGLCLGAAYFYKRD